MIAKEQIYQTVTLILIVGLLDTLERRRPRFPVNRRLNLRLNILTILVVIFVGELWKLDIMN
jgi:hypothetical protein